MFLSCVILACKKHSVDPCASAIRPTAEFAIREMIGDTAFDADTVFRDNYVAFQSLASYQSVKWKVGDDPRAFDKSFFTLIFYNSLVHIPVEFTGIRPPDNNCFPDDQGVYTGTRWLTTVEQFEKPTLTLSPMLGKYDGYYIDDPLDTFTVRIEYFDSAKYDVTVMGVKNFYWISNLPKGYIDSTSSMSYLYPELRNGQRPDMGYKALTFGSTSFCYAGKAWLVHDTLNAIVGAGSCKKRRFVGKRI